MLALPLGRFVYLHQQLSVFFQALESMKGSPNVNVLTDEFYERTVAHATEFHAVCGQMDMMVSQRVVAEVQNALRLAKKTNDGWEIGAIAINTISNHLRVMVGSLSSEASIKVSMILPAASISLYEQKEPLFGAQVAARFPSLTYDIQEAGKCLALGRSTAAVFHVVRCLEAGFAAIWRYLAVSDPITGYERNWSNRVKKVQEALEAKHPAKSGRMSDDAKFLDAVVGAIVAMQNPYRNNTMHFDEKYTEEEAKHILELVKGIMRRIAARIDEDGRISFL